MKEDFSELITYLDEKFNKIDEKFIDIDGKFLVVSSRLSNMEETLEKKADKIDVQNLLTAVDRYAEKADTYFQEMLMLSQKIDRHEKWFQIVADKLGIKLPY